MKNSYKLSLAAIAASMVLVGCTDSLKELAGDPGEDGGDDYNHTPTVITGQFIDAAVKGLNYTCTGFLDGDSNAVTHTGVTNDKGEFTCNEHDDVEFSLGNYIIGKVNLYSTDDRYIVTPAAFYGTTAGPLDIAQLLQTIDADKTDDILTIPENFSALDGVDARPGDTDFEDVMEGMLGIPLVSEIVAYTHMLESLESLSLNPADYSIHIDLNTAEVLEYFVSGKVLAFTNQTEPGMDLVATFNADYSYSESSDEHTCSGKWSVVSEYGNNHIGVTCDKPASTTMPTSPSDSDLVYQFWGDLTYGLTDGMSVTLQTSDENDVDVIFEGTITVTEL